MLVGCLDPGVQATVDWTLSSPLWGGALSVFLEVTLLMEQQEWRFSGHSSQGEAALPGRGRAH